MGKNGLREKFSFHQIRFYVKIVLGVALSGWKESSFNMTGETGSFKIMAQRTIKFLTIFLVALVSGGKLFSSEILSEEMYKTHLRWNIVSAKDQVIINKSGNTFTIKTLDQEFYNLLKAEFAKFPLNKEYFTKSEFLDGADVGTPSTLKMTMKSSDVELFTFYRSQERKYVIDFWVERDEVTSEKAAVEKVAPVIEVKKPEVVVKKETPKKVEIKASPVEAKTRPEYRDFRYGAAFIWDYPEFVPEVTKSINMNAKTAEEFYPVKNRDYEKSEREAHLQLTINLFKKKKWGLMNKSIKLYNEKFGEESESDLHEYLKANAILRDSFGKEDPSSVKMALSMYRTIAERTKDYDFKSAILTYLINYEVSANNFVQSLADAKKLFAVSRENYDYETATLAAEILLYSLAKLDQVEKINLVLQDKTLEKLLSKQKIWDFKIYSLLKNGKNTEVIALYEENKKSLAAPIAPSIIFNVAEAYFREAKYDQSTKLFDQFVSEHSGFTHASYARLRIALSYDLLGADAKKVEALYLQTLNRAGLDAIKYEAQIRYVAIRTIRKERRDEGDLETRVFLDIDEKKKNVVDKNIKKLLWLVRLRAFIVDGKYENALSYMTAIPTESLNPTDRRVLEADAAEIVYGLMLENYKKSDYAKVVRAWDAYHAKYISKVANDPLMNYIVSYSYIKLGLYDAFDKHYASFAKLAEGPEKSFPLWVQRSERVNRNIFLEELKVIRNLKLGNIELAVKYLNEMEASHPTDKKIDYFKGIIAHKQKNHKEAAMYLERYIVSENDKVSLDGTSVADMLIAFAESLYELGDVEKYKKVAAAIESDNSSWGEDQEEFSRAKKRVGYLYLEILASEGKQDSYLRLEEAIESYKKRYGKTNYDERLTFLLGVSKVANKKTDEARKAFESLINDATVSDYIKDLARSELALIRIGEKTL